MARPRTPVGTWGDITCTELRRGCWEAVAWFRERSGKLRRVTKRGGTKKSAENTLKQKLTELADEVRGKTITPDTRTVRVADLWLADIEQQAEAGQKSWNTFSNLRSWTRRWIVPGCGELSMRELEADIGVIEALFDRATRERSHATADGVRTAFSLLCDYACRHGALRFNPVRLAKSNGSPGRTAPRGLTREERADLTRRVEQFVEDRQVDKRGRRAPKGEAWRDLPDLCEAFMSTGIRAGELCALTADAFDVRARTIRVDAHIVRRPGVGLVRAPYRKGSADILVLRVPDWSAPMWSRRALAAGAEGPLFPAFRGGWRHPGHLATHLKTAFVAVGYDWLKSHALGRKTIALAMAEAGLQVGDIANQLGNTEKVVQRHYLPQRPANADTIAALEAMQ